MSNIDVSLLSLDATAQKALIEQGELTSAEITRQQLSAINVLEPSINAFISVDEACDKQSSVKHGVLSGINIALKDNIDVKGFVTTAGLKLANPLVAEQDSFVAANLRQAGVRFMGKLNMHEGALGATNHNAHYGNCYNPHQTDHTPGGSSGGSAAAVASCMVPLSLGTDTMGSVRIPASYCGLFGLKPSRGAVSNRGSVTCSRQMDNIGPLARSARDLALVFDVIQGFDQLSADSIDIVYDRQTPPAPVLLVPEDLDGLGVEASVARDFHDNLDVFREMGCTIKTFSFEDYDFGAARRAGLIICEAEMRVQHAHDWDNHIENFSPYLHNMLSFIERKSPMDIMRSERVLDNAVVTARGLFSKGDFLLMPTAPQRAFAMEDKVPANQADLTSFANQAALAALSMPMLSDNVLPAGMQLVGTGGSDYQLLALAEAWQRASGFKFSMPEYIRQKLQGV